MRRRLTLRYITDPSTGRRYPVPAGGAGDGDGGDPPAGDPPAGDPPANPPSGDPDPDGDPPGAEDLGDAGKKALDTMKGERNAARDELRPWKAVADELGLTPEKVRELAAASNGKPIDVDQVRKEARDEALKSVGQIAVRANVKAQATGRLADPADALAFIDLSQFEVTEDGDVDEQAIGAAIDDLLEQKPHLAAQGGQKWQGGSDGGARNDPPKPEPKPGLDRLRHAYQSN